ncbi:MAG: hypothetical protein QF570_21960 [Myxococcota bacterium]|nr:hypothetical protein [Myxococcota bacterium]
MSEHSALEVGAKLSFYESCDGRLLLPGVREKGFELFADDLVKEGLLGSVAFVFDRGCLAGTAGESTKSKFEATSFPVARDRMCHSLRACSRDE